jgi:Fe-Mn family superoxide dismutase
MIHFVPPTWDLSSLVGVASAQAMDIHVNTLHRGYVNKINQKFERSGLLEVPPSVVLSDVSSFISDKNDAQFYIDNMGGAFAHTLFWQIINPNRVSQGDPTLEEIKRQSLDLAKGFVGSGWVWGALSRGNLRVYTARNHNTPFMRKEYPLFTIDLWEHAYFLDYFASRADWVSNIVDLLDLNKINSYIPHTEQDPMVHPIDNLLLHGKA